MAEHDDPKPAGAPEPGEPTTGPTEPQASPDPHAAPTEAGEATSHQPASGGPAGGEPPAGDPPADAPDGGAAEPERPRRLYRAKEGRMLAGVAAGLGDYFGIDPVIVRVIAIALVFAGGAGLLLYVAAWLLVPEEGDDEERSAGFLATVGGGIALIAAVCVVIPFWGGPFGADGWAGPFVFFAFLGVAGLVVWRLATGEHSLGGGARETLRRAGLGLALLALCGLFAFGGAWATASGGGTVVAIIVIVAGLWLVAGAFIGNARWLILPALALALPAGVVSAANIDTRGGIGEREYRPLSAGDVRDEYEVGLGRLVIDLRDADLPAGDRTMRVDVGMGEAWVIVPEDVCVTSHGDAGAGELSAFDRSVGGVDVDWEDVRRAAAGTPRLIVDGHVGVGAIRISHEEPDRHDFGPRDGFREAGNAACIGGARG